MDVRDRGNAERNDVLSRYAPTKQRRYELDKAREHFQWERTWTYVTEEMRNATMYCEVYPLFKKVR